jgi:hypothetical protein
VNEMNVQVPYALDPQVTSQGDTDQGLVGNAKALAEAKITAETTISERHRPRLKARDGITEEMKNGIS